MSEQIGSEYDPGFEAILEHLKETRGFDFTGYKRSGLVRRVSRRMAQVGIGDYPGYLDHLQVDADEFAALFNTILINVTGFFRDPDAWDYLQSEMVPMLLAERGPGDQVRIWSAGCSSGEEAYSLAIVLAEALGVEQFRQRVKIYATDVDEEALAQARQATYGQRELEALPEAYAQKYFERQGGRYVFHKELRRSVIFGRNDLVQDAPISRIDLLLCRNTLMYFNAETQSGILRKLHFALLPRGVLFVGKAEMLLSHTRLFDPIDPKHRLFRKIATAPVGGSMFGAPYVHEQRATLDARDELRALAFSGSPVAQIVVNSDDLVALSNQQAQQLFGVSDLDVGRPLRDLEISYRPVELRGYVEQVRTERRALRVKDVEWQRGPGEVIALELHVSPLVSLGDDVIGVSVVFHDVTASHRLFAELAGANRQRENAYEELQSATEELETTNEELQSTVEELETTNEELQSTNEELETTNEELKSTNDELQTINNALRDRTSELDDLNEFLESVLTSLRAGVVVVDHQMRVVAWNAGAEELWGLRHEEVEGEHLLNLDIGLPVAELGPVVRPALADPAYTEEVVLAAVNRRGRHVTVRIACGALRRRGGESTGAILVMETTDGVLEPSTPDAARTSGDRS
ncbi:PAS domain S-box protein [Amycolatopsis acidiphila]|uniref:protein-glutamate O-methyltransferase n=1 Tax=Amycolatopsis acidiphila TaxID=715473 RepID=A0A558A8K7_9PSEU|nr:CheR family methyltransferase [Amycolatopsis acidiphila]TVT20594.1 PAS domain S-box protein [Amycolatopsis acidiphila]UIJ61412.1 PAS domain S-box protein [Amycolatopsis acidiphila]GHG77832.1 chemotaxis protein CheR [Amycolatopsis acidiphila]